MARKSREIMLLSLDDQIILIENGGKPEVHKVDIKKCLGYFEQGEYKLTVFRDQSLALSYQMRRYGAKSCGYTQLKKYLENLTNQ